MTAALAAALGYIMAKAPPAAAEMQASGISGRWTQMVAESKQPGLTYDVVRCGDGWCGIEVKDGKDCGRIALRLDAGAAHAYGVEFFGRYERAQGTAPYTVNATLHPASPKDPPNTQPRLSVRGNPGSTLDAFRRTFPLHMAFRREGEPTCRADPKLS
jgi:hypothetical protein